ncbi:MAG TPA: DUF397 domain-containing protein [Pseudonocardiaceae bacterium]|nr:DUF397 domain-containing protein [Pseudonocardiaceae bacterium]
MDTTIERWRKSRHSSGQNGNCVELSNLGAVRDSKNPEGPILLVDVLALVTAVKDRARR